jgi:pullulanase/glycogen debranching enzyme
LRGLADGDYYLQHGDGSSIDDTGCGNTFNANHPVVGRLIHHSLRHWVQHLHVDGFRFDLASVLDRDQTGQPTPLSPILWDIDTDPVLAMGNEMGRSQQGNNNAYAQDNAISWLDWSLLERQADLHRFVRELVRYRQRRDVVVHARSLSLGELVQRHQVSWHGVEPNQPDWSDSSRASPARSWC